MPVLLSHKSDNWKQFHKMLLSWRIEIAREEINGVILFSEASYFKLDVYR